MHGVNGLMITTLFCSGMAASPAPVASSASDATSLAEWSPPQAVMSPRRHFLIRADAAATSDEHFDRLQQELERTHDLFYQVLGRAGFQLDPLTQPLVWMVFADRQKYDRYVWETERQEIPDLDSYYSPRTNRVALICYTPMVPRPPLAQMRLVSSVGGETPLRSPQPYRGELDDDAPGRVAHEAAHQLAFNSGLQIRGVMYPFWVAEGLATGFETPKGPVDVNTIRCKHLLAARQRGELMPLQDFLTLVHVRLATTQQVQDLYGQAWGIFHYLLTEHPAKLRLYLKNLAHAQPGWQPREVRERQVLAVLGPMDELEAGWQALLDRLETDQMSRQWCLASAISSPMQVNFFEPSQLARIPDADPAH